MTWIPEWNFGDLENALNSKVRKWIGRLMHHHHCQCIDIIATVTKFSFEVLWNHKGLKSSQPVSIILYYFGANKEDFKAIFKQYAKIKKEMLLCQRKAWCCATVANLNFSMKCVMEVCGKCSIKTLCTFRKLPIDESLMKCYYNYN